MEFGTAPSCTLRVDGGTFLAIENLGCRDRLGPGAHRLAVVIAACALAAACTGALQGDEPRPTAATAGGGDAWEVTLCGLAEEALDRGDLDAAERRFGRVLAARPGSTRARLGLGRVALANGRVEEARGHFDAVVAAEPDSVGAEIGLADALQRGGDTGAAAQTLRRAAARAPDRFEIHARLADLTGRAPRIEIAEGEALRAARDHPYDPRARVAAGASLLRAGDERAAIAHLEDALWLADIDPSAAREALALLRQNAESWRDRRVVAVHAFADARLRAQRGWKFQLRSVWRDTSEAIAPHFDVSFVVVTIGAFDGPGEGARLDAVHGAFLARAPRPRAGIVAAFTGQPALRSRVPDKEGLAEFLGRAMTVRLAPGAVESRVLAHEILHLYGAVHVAPDLESLMNPSGSSTALDPLNFRIVRATRTRRFDGGSLERDVTSHIDLDAAIDAYVAALSANIAFRRLGLEAALQEADTSRYLASATARRAQALDAHLADVAWTVSALMRARGREVEALFLIDSAAQLYGAHSRRGQEAQKNADALRAYLQRKYGR